MTMASSVHHIIEKKFAFDLIVKKFIYKDKTVKLSIKQGI